MEDIKFYQKEHNPDLSVAYKLAHREIRCRCSHEDCTYTMISDRILRTFSIVRKIWSSPIIVTSAYRCQRHNKLVGGYPDSYHKRGMAIDIFPNNGDIEGLYALCQKFFDFVKIYPDEGFIHCHFTYEQGDC